MSEHDGAHETPSPYALPALNEIFQHLGKHDSDWLTETLQDRWQQLSRKPGHPLTIHKPLPVSSTDITLPHLPDGLQISPYIKSLREHDWSSTKFGPISGWSLELRRAVNRCLFDHEIAVILIGPRLHAIYNEAYSQLISTKHPYALGQSVFEVWPEVSHDDIQPLVDCQRLGVSWIEINKPLVVDRQGFMEELCLTLSVTPIVDDAGHTIGCYETLQDHTSREKLSRRMDTLLSLSQVTVTATNTSDFWEKAMEGLRIHATDTPFAIVYSYALHRSDASDHSSSSAPSNGESRQWSLVSNTGLPPESPPLPSHLDSATAESLFGAQFHKSANERKPSLLDPSAPAIASLFNTLVPPTRSRNAQQRRIVLLPICPAKHEDAYGFVLLELDPMAAYDLEYQQFVRLLQRQLETSLASVLLVEAEMHQLHTAAERAAEDRLQLAEQLAETQREAFENRSRFRGMVDIAPLAMFHLDEDGDILYANQNWIDITQHTASEWSRKSWFDAVHQEDKEMVDAAWSKLLAGQSVSFSMRWEGDYAHKEAFYIGSERIAGATWTIATAYPEKREDGTVKGVVGCLTDISKQKWIEDFHERRMLEALELKRQQENFMDMISHEARNPLSAIMLCTESILGLLTNIADTKPVDGHSLDASFTDMTITKGIEDAEIVLACAQHQKRMIDDVLTLSKLDAGLLLFHPVDVQLRDTIMQAVKMFEVELTKNDVHYTFTVHQSYDNLAVDWLRLDPNRLLQVLINLLTNAIKFTKAQATRSIRMTMSAGLTRPTTSLTGVSYISRTHEEEANETDQVFITFEVEDTGCGIKPHEVDRLFKKFQQATPKTHVEYGGSGLGLFISRQLTQMLGGSIGLKSSPSGSTFAFYITAPRCAPPTQIPQSNSTVSSAGVKTTILDASGPVVPPDTSTTISKPHILVVEDNIVNQKVLRSQLERLQYPVSVANHGMEALDYISTSRFCRPNGEPLDIMLLDVEMPVCNGLDCARQIRALQESGTITAHIPIIGVTANARAEQLKAVTDAGMDAVVTKPFRLRELSHELELMANRFYG